MANIDIVHAYIHEGRCWFTNEADSDVDIAGPKIYRLDVPSSPEIHLVFEFASSGAGLLEFYEGITSGDGAEMSYYNRNREITYSPQLDIYKDSTFTGGTAIWSARVGTAGNPVTQAGGQQGSRYEFILKPSTKYGLKFTTTADNNQTTCTFDWYEIVDKIERRTT